MFIISFIALIIGGLNWMSIGLLQYDFIAGFFGTQASIFSRLIYIAIGVACIFVIIDMLKNKGKIILFKRKIKKSLSSNNDEDDVLSDN